ncbi:MAG: glycosyltransferase family 1 protein [bacterium]|nr:glycosyltransferase family 1 protein [bacterium]
MKIGIVLHPYGEDKPAGLARTIFELTTGMIAEDRENDYIIFLKNKPRVLPEFSGKNWRIEILGSGYLWLDRLKTAPRADVYVFNTPVLPLFWRPPKSIALALDFAYLDFPPHGFFGRILNTITYWYHRRSLWRADRIVAISEATKRETMRIFHMQAEKIDVVRCGFKRVCAVPETRLALPENFFLFVGIVKERKNVFNVVRGFNAFQKTHRDYHLVIAGNAVGPYADAIREYITAEKLEEKIIFPGHMNDGQLSYMYRRAMALVFPSFIEGFGYPVLEGMDCGIPVVTSDQSSLAEVGGDAALLIDPHRPEAIAGAMARIADEPGVREELIKKGHERTKLFSWHKAGREMTAVCKKVCGSSS